VDSTDRDGHRPIPTSCCFYLAFYLSEFFSVVFSICKRTERWEWEWEWEWVRVRKGTWDLEGGQGAAAGLAWQRRVPLLVYEVEAVPDLIEWLGKAVLSMVTRSGWLLIHPIHLDTALKKDRISADITIQPYLQPTTAFAEASASFRLSCVP
jgi:hypothetical protein